MTINKKTVLFIILFIAALLRLWKLGSIPPGLTPDEAALGYNAYSILKTGRDEHGEALPVVFKSFGDFKPGLYVYTAIPSVFLFGLSEFAVRLPSAAAGVVSIYLLYIIVRKLFPEHKNLPLFAAFVAALNPYLVYFSRGAWEANLSLTLTLGGVYFFIKALEDSKFLIHSSVLFSLTLLAYQGAKLSSAIVLILLILSFWKDFWRIERGTLIRALILGLIITAPILASILNGQTQRLTIFSVFSYPRPASEIATYAGPFFNIFHSDNLNYIRMILSRWFNFYSGQFLFFTGDTANPVHTPPYQGVLMLVDLLMLPLGLFAIFKNKLHRGSLFIFLWLLISPFSGAISRDQTNAVRTLNAAIPMAVIISIGLDLFTGYLSKLKNRTLYYLPLLALYLFSLVYYLDAYFVHMPVHNSEFSRYGYKEAVLYVNRERGNYSQVVFEQSFNQPYVYFLFYGRYDPLKWQAQSKLVDSQYKGDVGFQTKIDNIHFENLDWSKLRNSQNTLVVAGANKIPPEIRNSANSFPVVYEIRYLNGRDLAFEIVKIK